MFNQNLSPAFQAHINNFVLRISQLNFNSPWTKHDKIDCSFCHLKLTIFLVLSVTVNDRRFYKGKNHETFSSLFSLYPHHVQQIQHLSHVSTHLTKSPPQHSYSSDCHAFYELLKMISNLDTIQPFLTASCPFLCSSCLIILKN